MNSFQFEALIHLFYLYPLFLTTTKQKRKKQETIDEILYFIRNLFIN